MAKPPSPLEKQLLGEPTPQTDQEWMQLDFRAADIFSPHSPIDEEQLLAGRLELIDGLIETVFQRGQHAILYGERGVGKTSLANVLGTKLFVKSTRYSVIKRNCTDAHHFKLIWEHLLDKIPSTDGSAVGHNLSYDANAYDVYTAIEQLPTSMHPIFVVDEYDRIRDEQTHVKMADTIKYLSDYSSRATIVIIGVARDVRELFGGHPSIERNVRQLPMPLMKRDELAQIFAKRLPDLGMTFDEDTQDTLIRLAQGLPGYTHLLGQYAARNAIKRRSLHIELKDLNTALFKSLDACDEKIKDLYDRAVRSTKPGNQYRQALLACALAPIDERGYFTSKSVKDPFSKVMGRPMEIPHFARHLSEFCGDERGPALRKEGRPKSFVFRFSDALLRPFVVIKGINDKLITQKSVK